MSNLGPISHFLSPVSCDSLVLQGLRCEWGAGVFNLVLSLSLSHTGHWKFNMAPHGKELSEYLKKIIVALHQWFSTFFSTGQHYGPSASLTGRTHVIYILRHQYKPTRFIILSIAKILWYLNDYIYLNKLFYSPIIKHLMLSGTNSVKFCSKWVTAQWSWDCKLQSVRRARKCYLTRDIAESVRSQM